ncbi:MAG: hypothetical protein P9M14_13725 [Candidatus Alcyoniella australis]|nr:hypothetical protein [Candidatus Alcyoniella australis]
MRKSRVAVVCAALLCFVFVSTALAVLFKQQQKDYVAMNVLTGDERTNAFRSCQNGELGTDHGPVKIEVYLDMRDPTDIKAIRVYPIEGGERIFTDVSGISYYKSFREEGLAEVPTSKGVYAYPTTEDFCFGFSVEYYNHTDFLP